MTPVISARHDRHRFVRDDHRRDLQ